MKLRVENTNFGDTEDDRGVGQEKWGLREIGGGRADSIRIPPSVEPLCVLAKAVGNVGEVLEILLKVGGLRKSFLNISFTLLFL